MSGDGYITVRDYPGPGSGPVVVLIHGLGMCAMNWEPMAALLAAHCRVLAVDLPGHGQSTATMRTPFAVFECILDVATALDLAPCLLVGHDQGSLVALEALSAKPELFSGAVAIGGSIVRTRAEMAEMCEFAASEYFSQAMRERFKFGVTGESPLQAEQVIEAIIANGDSDWLMRDIGGLREELNYCFRYKADGTWVRQPDPEDVAMVGRFPSDSHLFPTQDRLPELAAPMWILQLASGLEVQLADRERTLAAEFEQLRLVRLNCGQWPQHEMPDQLAELLRLIADDPQAPGLA